MTTTTNEEAAKRADDELGRLWAEAVKARLVSRGKGLARAETGVSEPPWVTRAQARIDHIYEVNGNEIRFDVVDQIIAEERLNAAEVRPLGDVGPTSLPDDDNRSTRKEAIDAAFDNTDTNIPPASVADEVIATVNAAIAEAEKPKKAEKAKRIVDDNYPTPFWPLARFLETPDALALPGGNWLEPTAGSGAIIKNTAKFFTGINWHAVELREEHEDALATSGAASYEIGDFLTVGPALVAEHAAKLAALKQAVYTKPFEVGLGNPPYNKAFEIIQAMWPLCNHIVLLLRVNFLAGERRAEWMRAHTPDVFVLPNRPSFAHEGGTDMTEYAWFWWRTNDRHEGENGQVVILASTPKADRK